MKRTRYKILTWDIDKKCHTPQIGMPKTVSGFRGIRRAIRKLRRMGWEYDGDILFEPLSNQKRLAIER